MESSVLIENTPEYSSDIDIISRAQQGDSRAMEHLLFKYRNMVRKKVQHFYVRGADKEDLLQIGMIGLWQAVNDYCFEKNITFMSFAKICIERHIITAIKSSTRKKQSFLNDALSLDYYSDSNDAEFTLSEIVAAPLETCPEERLLQKEKLASLHYSIQKMLSEFEWDVLLLHHRGKSYCEIACLLGCKAKAVDNALVRIRRKLEVSDIVPVEC